MEEIDQAPLVSVRCRRCRLTFKLSAAHEDVAHPFPGPICPMCEDEEREENYEECCVDKEDEEDLGCD